MDKGKIIVIEGTDCSGKETQTKKLMERLKENNIDVISFSFPNYNSPTGKIVGGPYLGKPEIGESYFGEGALTLDPKIACAYYAADRRYNLGKIYDYLNKGYFVILDRYVSSNQAHQGGKLDNKEDRLEIYKWIDRLEYDLYELPKPDITIFLHVPYKFAKELKKNRKNLDIHEKSEKHLINAEKSYLELSEIYNWNYIECIRDNKLRTIEDISDEIYNIVTRSNELNDGKKLVKKI